MTAKTKEEVDAIWASMKGEAPTSLTESSFDHDSLKAAKRKAAKKKTKVKPSSNSAPVGANHVVQERRSNVFPFSGIRSIAGQSTNELAFPCEQSGAILSWAQGHSTIEAASDALSFGDSDDEIEGGGSAQGDANEAPCKTSGGGMVSGRPWSVDRLVSSMKSGEKTIRTEALLALEGAVRDLHSRLPQVPGLDFPPPYDASRIALTHKSGAMVSDMASGSWSQWQRTHASLSDQFQCKVENPGADKEKPTSLRSDKVNHAAPSISEHAAIRRQLQAILNGCGNALFLRIGDVESERCRCLSLRCISMLSLGALDVGKHVAYLAPALLARYPPVYFDGEMDVFVHDVDSHEMYRRGVARERQDREDALSRTAAVDVVEGSEEIRLLLCDVFSSLVRGSVFRGATALDAYFSDMIFALQASLRDPYPAVKVEASLLLVQLMRMPQFEAGACTFSTALARAAIPNLRHRSAKVRLASLDLFEASVSVPNRAKIKGAGTAAILDLVGFREENVLPIAAFYDSRGAISLNTLAEIVSDKNPKVRARCCAMLSFFMICLPDRYDHQQRLLPYLLSFLNDDVRGTRLMASSALENCGDQYEAEHPDDVVERRQYGVDGDSRCNHDAPLPAPFETRPRLGARLFVRANTKRFFRAILGELTNWISTTRSRSAELLALLVVYCEEHLTMDFHETLPSLASAIRIARGDIDKRTAEESVEQLLHVLELCGRYVDPDTYVPLCLPRIAADVKSSASFADGGSISKASRVAYASCLSSMLSGSSAGRILPHAKTIAKALSSDDCVGGYVGGTTRSACTLVLVTMLECIGDKESKRAIKIHLQQFQNVSDIREVLCLCSKCFSDKLADQTGDADKDSVALVKRGNAAIKVLEDAINASI